MNFEEEINKYNACFNDLTPHLEKLHNYVIESNEQLEGNCFYSHLTTNLTNVLVSKQVNLYNIAKRGNKICEIGFNARHSALLFVLNHPLENIEFTIFDINEHAYTHPCLEYIKTSFSHIKFKYIEGNSIETIPKFMNETPSEINKYNIIHVDGGHLPIYVDNDMKNADLLVASDGYIILDDTQDKYINTVANKYIDSGRYKEINIMPTIYYTHRILQKCIDDASN